MYGQLVWRTLSDGLWWHGTNELTLEDVIGIVLGYGSSTEGVNGHGEFSVLRLKPFVLSVAGVILLVQEL